VGGDAWCSGRVGGHAGTAPDATDLSPLPARVEGFAGVTSIGVGGDHTCLVVEGRVTCWGGNWGGQVGVGPIADGPVGPTLVAGIEGVNAIAAGMGRTCALTGGGLAWCWGGDEGGALGAGQELGASVAPVQGVGLTGVTSVIPAGDHTCAIAGGRVSCWGTTDNDSVRPLAVRLPR
jgi:alpha-tubulin suppressor-like RCC1 family protein